ncbi:sensor histidine kinase [Treponema sp.]|uniref:sensor histidine kinase n=1 Tax=Treponema sp. TaxID=166 RepID=UPI00388F5AEA
MKIIKQLRIKFILSIMLVEVFIFAGVILFLNVMLTKHDRNEARQFLEMLVENNGHRPDPPKPREIQDSFHGDFDATTSSLKNHSDFLNKSRSPFLGVLHQKDGGLRNYFAVKISPKGEVLEFIQDFPINYTDEEIQKLIETIFEEEKRTGTIDGIMYKVSPIESGNKLICFLNRNAELKTLYKLYIYSIICYVICLIISLIISVPISYAMISPVQDAFIKQKQFIADAGHELKTPIAVISANIDVLENEIKNNKWLEYIKTENLRMGELVKDLLYLAKNDAGKSEFQFIDFDFSNAAENSILPFEVVAFESSKRLVLDIQKGLICNGDEKSIKQIFIILVDNAIKNSENGATITVKAYSDNQKIYLKVHNTGNGIPKEELEKIFLRFYRSDSSRARKTGGYGLGLAIARTIALEHGGTLYATSELGKWAEFTLTLPKKH